MPTRLIAGCILFLTISLSPLLAAPVESEETVENYKAEGLTLVAPTPVAPQPRGAWERIAVKIREAADYSCILDYSGSEGHYRFAYAAIPSVPRTRTEILPESDRGVGVVVVYDASRSLDCVFMDLGLLRLRRSLSSKDLRDSSLEVPIFTQFLTRLEGAPRTVEAIAYQGRELTRFVFSDRKSADQVHHMFTDEDHNIVRYERHAGKILLESFDLSDVRWNTQPVIDF